MFLNQVCTYSQPMTHSQPCVPGFLKLFYEKCECVCMYVCIYACTVCMLYVQYVCMYICLSFRTHMSKPLI